MPLPLLSLAGKGLSALGKRRAARKAAQAQTGQQVAQNITGTKVDKSQNPRISFGHDSPAMSSAMNISESTGRSTRTATTSEGVALQIETKTIHLKDALRRSLILDKAHEKNRKTIIKKAKGTKAEEDLEKDAKKGGKFALPIPGAGKVKSFWQRIQDFILTVVWGRIAVLMLDKTKFLGEWLPRIGGAVDWIMDMAGKFLNVLATAVKIGYDAYDWTRGVIGNVFGEKGLETFDKISGVMNTMLNASISLGLAMIALSNEFGSSLLDWGKGTVSIFKHGLRRAGPRLLIKMFGKKTAAGLLGKGVATKTATVAGTAKGAGLLAGIKTTAGTVVGGGLKFASKANPIMLAGFLASLLGEGGFQLKKIAQDQEEKSLKRFKDKAWWNPMKYFWGAKHLADKFSSFLYGGIGTLLDIIGTPFRYLGELIKYPFLDKAGKEKQRINMAKFDARIREQFREIINAFSLGMLAKEKGAFGSLFGKKGTDAMGYTSEPSEVLGGVGADVEIPTPKSPQEIDSSPAGTRAEGSELAGELGRFLDTKGLGAWGSGVHQHPEHPPWPRESGHRAGSLHYQSQGARAIDIGGWGPNLFRRKGEKGVDDQTKIIEGIRAFEESKGGLKRAEFAHEGNDPTGGHDDHVHIAYEKGGVTLGKPHLALMGEKGNELVIDANSMGPAKDMLLAINQASTYEGIVDAIKKFAPYEALTSETITIPNPRVEAQQNIGADNKKKIDLLPIFAGSDADPYEVLYKGS